MNKATQKPIIGMINHGCPKNLVDAELMLGMLGDAGYKITLDETESEIIIVNTCSFIHDAERESVRSILEMVDEGKKVIITGCLPQKYKQELMEEIPEAFALLGTSDIENIVSVVEALDSKEIKRVYQVNDKPIIIYPETAQRQQITVGSSSYIKIAEGCNYKCGYCIIPQLRGPYISRNIDDVVKEARMLGDKGVSEVILIAQDTSYYGMDKYGSPVLASLLEKINDVDSIDWIRVMYTYPSMFNDELIEAMASLDKVVKYIDIPLQHSHPDMLKAMQRPVGDYAELIQKIRSKIKDVALRTAFIVGYPTETNEQFEHLYDFVKEVRFDKLGVFEYSREKNTKSYNMKPQIADEVKAERKNAIMELQQQISSEINQSQVGKKLPTLIESLTSTGQVIGRTFRDAPDVDGLIYIDTDKAVVPGDIELVTVTDADEYDLFGKL